MCCLAALGKKGRGCDCVGHLWVRGRALWMEQEATVAPLWQASQEANTACGGDILPLGL